MRVLCLSNGHGEDLIAARVLQELRRCSGDVEVAALPLVGIGRNYRTQQIPIIGLTKGMPSGGFIYMDWRQLWRDLQGGLLGLFFSQVQSMRQWLREGGIVLAVGDIVPLGLAWLSGVDYAFVGTAKSEYYLRDEMGWYRHRPMARWFEGWSGSVYLPWERWLMSRPQCRAVFPRDSFTTEVLEQWQIPLFDLGNPMMDDLQSPSLELCTVTPISPIETQGETQQEMQRPALTIVLMPGSRQPEAFNNWQLILQAVHILIRAISHNAISQDVNGFLSLSSKDLWNNSESDFPVGHFQADRQPNPPIKLLFLAAIAPGLEIAPICQSLTQQEWQLIQNQEFQDRELKRQLDSALNGEKLQFQQGIAQLVIARAAFNQCIQQADLAIAMAGTATEQFVGLGKPAITLPGAGPQFTYRFAEAQQRLLGESVVLANSPAEIPEIVRSLLGDTNRLKRIAANGQRRMGQPGAAHRIAACFLKQMENSND